MELTDRRIRPKIDKRIFLSSPHMGNYEKKFIDEAFLTNWIAPLGPNVESFEKELSNYVGSGGGVALSSGTAAVHMAVKLLGVTKGDIVFCSSLTFVATCNPIIYEGAEPVFIDSEPESLNMSPIALENAFKYYEELGKMPRAVIVVHLYGQSADMYPIMEICNRYNVPVIEDAAESLGATYKGSQTGTIGKYGIYSFNGNKIITTSGGGMLVSNNIDGLHKAKFWSTQSRDEARHYQHSELGYNYRMSNVVAGIGRGQLRVIEKRIEKKKQIYDFYKDEFSEIEEITMAPIRDYGEPNYWLSIIILSEDSKIKPLDIILALESENIESRHVWKPIHLQPYYEKYRIFKHDDDFDISIAEDIFNRGVCLPSDTKMTIEEQEYVIEIIKELFI
ncbi:UDP-4-amino-4-deoxy-L-arabinose--oxoglutarate aminotransferase [uncultured Clostridium sp.]|uniref:DegT/DnrJ/EryC1/StrS family aminotransferase n=1 Tax=uncultured Clostridium sp. TaxID=59620 RepID=UPI0008207462|nr:DegT/DnrJ/EryC1/StrS family aminotransferase [uncultured Clostridium sp.]SCJ34034.1 UDP-4-amino-4-deoxy-L-arabinose--oxoglutarate aminotransferase [uncultured Clostridium sp.]